MRIFEEILENLKEEVDEMEFPDIIYQARDRIGLVQYRLSEHLGIPINRLKNLETGHFRAMPRESEIRLLSELYRRKSGGVS